MAKKSRPSKLRTFIIHPHVPSESARDPALRLEEALSLSAAIDLDIVQSEIIRLRAVTPASYIGKGRSQELVNEIKDLEIDLVVMDCALTAVQQRNLERDWGIKVLDRTGLILEIFGARANTREGVLQVELAALNFARSRLVRSWTHLERQRGGLGFVGGAGETQIEADRRAIDDAIVRLRKQLDKVVRTRSLHREARKKVPYPIVALVGYTNAGKSTLFNALTGEDVMAKDMLFATLDPTMREYILPSGQKIILSDTVGFISDLPTQLVAAFRATLEEVLDADLVLHVRDISHVESKSQARDVSAILNELAGDDENALAPIIEVWNKSDLLNTQERSEAQNRVARDASIELISAVKGEGLTVLAQRIDEALAPKKTRELVILPISATKERAWLFNQNVVESEDVDENKYSISVAWSVKQKNQFSKL